MSEIETHCNHTKMEDLVNLIPHPQNPNKHTDKQIALLAKVIKHTGWRSPIVISKKSGFIVAGHCRLEAAKLLDADKVPIEEQDFKTEAEEYAHLVADNRIAELSNLAADLTLDILQKLKEDDSFDLELSGYTDDEFQALFDVTKPVDYSDPEVPKDKTLKEWKDVYDSTNLRQITLIFQEEEFAGILEKINAIREAKGLETNTEAVSEALNAYKI